MGKLIEYAWVSTRGQDTYRQTTDLLATGVRRDNLYIDRGASGARASRPALDRALAVLHAGNALVITALDRLGRSAPTCSSSPNASRTKAQTYAY